jgi:hypothetical protein
MFFNRIEIFFNVELSYKARLKLPGFTAEQSLGNNCNKYHEQPLPLFVSDERIIPALRWGRFQRDSCTSSNPGLRQFSSVLWDIPRGQSWEEACRNTPATIGGRTYHASRCKNKINSMWGEFDVFDPSCYPDPCPAKFTKKWCAIATMWCQDMCSQAGQTFPLGRPYNCGVCVGLPGKVP